MGPRVGIAIVAVAAAFGSVFTVTPALAQFPTAAAPTAPAVEINGDCPGLVRIRVDGATPEGELEVVAGAEEGAFRIAGLTCLGTELGIADPAFIRMFTADASGALELQANMPEALCSQRFQMVDVASCDLTEVFLLCGEPDLYWPDADEDGYGDSASEPVASCVPVPDLVTNGDDCDDADALTYPGATEVCDFADNDCDGQVDEGLVFDDQWRDADGDGFGNPDLQGSHCAPLNGYAYNNEDCYDDNAFARPGSSYWAAFDRGDGSYDYDCDGVESHYYGVAECVEISDRDCRPDRLGFLDPAPDCGDSGDLLYSCSWNIFEGCTVDLTSRDPQKCQ